MGKKHTSSEKLHPKIRKQNDSGEISPDSKAIKKANKKYMYHGNFVIIDGLQKLMRKYELEKNRGKVFGYGRAIESLKQFKEHITSVDQVKGLVGIGKGICEKIQEVLDNGVFREVKNPFSDEKMKAIEEIQGIHGVGSVGAVNLYDRGFTSIEKIRKDPSCLTRI